MPQNIRLSENEDEEAAQCFRGLVKYVWYEQKEQNKGQGRQARDRKGTSPTRALIYSSGLFMTRAFFLSGDSGTGTTGTCSKFINIRRIPIRIGTDL